MVRRGGRGGIWLASGRLFDDDVASAIEFRVDRAIQEEIIEEGTTTVEALAEHFADHLGLNVPDAEATIAMYLRWYVDSVAVSPSGAVADESRTQAVWVRHGLRPDEAAARDRDGRRVAALDGVAASPAPSSPGWCR